MWVPSADVDGYKRRSITGTGGRSVTMICLRPVPLEAKHFARDVRTLGVRRVPPEPPKPSKPQAKTRTPGGHACFPRTIPRAEKPYRQPSDRAKTRFREY